MPSVRAEETQDRYMGIAPNNNMWMDRSNQVISITEIMRTLFRHTARELSPQKDSWHSVSTHNGLSTDRNLRQPKSRLQSWDSRSKVQLHSKKERLSSSIPLVSSATHPREQIPPSSTRQIQLPRRRPPSTWETVSSISAAKRASSSISKRWITRARPS